MRSDFSLNHATRQNRQKDMSYYNRRVLLIADLFQIVGRAAKNCLFARNEKHWYLYSLIFFGGGVSMYYV